MSLRQKLYTQNLYSTASQYHKILMANMTTRTYLPSPTTSFIRTSYVKHNEKKSSRIQLNNKTERYKLQTPESTQKSRPCPNKFISF